MKHAALAALVVTLAASAPAIAARQAAPAGPDFVALGRTTIDELSKKAFDKFIARLDPKVGAVLNEQKLAALWTQITTQSGEFKSIESARVETAQGAHVVTVTCVFEKQNLGLRVAFNDDQKIIGFFIVPPEPPPGAPQARRPQDPVAPFPYAEEEVGYQTGNARLAGTLTIPAGKGPFPAVLLVTGSGPQDRNESIAGHRPFLVLADYLTRRGIAVLRVDDRGVGKSTGTLKALTSADLIEDAQAGVGYLKTRGEVDRARIGLLGHSEGGVIAPAVAARNSDVAYIVMLAGPGVSGLEIVPEQVRLAAQTGGLAPEQVTALATKQRELLNAVIANASRDEMTVRIKALAPAAPDAAVDEVVSQLSSPWYRYFLTYDPALVLRQVHCPVLALYGEKDSQVSPKQNLPVVQRALEASGNKRFEVMEWPGLNHLFQNAKTGDPSEYARIDETIAPGVLEKIAAWIGGLTPVLLSR